MRKEKLLTNEEIIANAMNFSNFGAMAQMVIVHAIRQYVDLVAAIETKPDDWNDFVCWESWQGACKEISEKMRKFYS